MPIDSLTPRQIRHIRLSHGLSQRRCAEMVGVKLRCWQYWETECEDRRRMPAPAIRLWLRTLMISDWELDALLSILERDEGVCAGAQHLDAPADHADGE